MSPALQTLIDRYQPSSLSEWENALKEIVQELALLGLWRSKFYEHAAFYGGTALRIFHGLPRFSEDMDFSLLTADSDFKLARYLTAIETELGAYGFRFEAKTNSRSRRLRNSETDYRNNRSSRSSWRSIPIRRRAQITKSRPCSYRSPSK